MMHAADPRYGHTCCARGAHSVSKLNYTAAAAGPITTRIEADTYYRAFSMTNGGDHYRNGPVRRSARKPHAPGGVGVTMDTPVHTQPVTEVVAGASSREALQPPTARVSRDLSG